MNWKLWLRKKFPTHVERKILKQIKGKTLDVGCGRGLFLFYSQSRCLKTVGLEIDRRKIKEAKKTTNRFIVLGDAHNIPFKEGIFDNIVALDILEHVRIPAKVIEEVSRVIKPRGRAFFHIPRGRGVFRHMEGHINFFDSKEEIRALLEWQFKIKKASCIGFKWFIRPPLISPSYNLFWILSTFITCNLPEFLSTHFYFEVAKK
jgi:2-polyprenyl-3-methyl-5-hydroxy-6-metoxy-1,4-benzoquinol methylase